MRGTCFILLETQFYFSSVGLTLYNARGMRRSHITNSNTLAALYDVYMCMKLYAVGGRYSASLFTVISSCTIRVHDSWCVCHHTQNKQPGGIADNTTPNRREDNKYTIRTRFHYARSNQKCGVKNKQEIRRRVAWKKM